MSTSQDEWKRIPYTRRREIVLTLRQAYASTCHLCGLYVPEEEASVDHITPASKGGASTIDNLALAHKSCNYARGARPIKSAQVPEHDGLAEFIAADEAAGR